MIDFNPRLGILFLKLANGEDGNLGIIRGLDRGSNSHNDGIKDRQSRMNHSQMARFLVD